MALSAQRALLEKTQQLAIEFLEGLDRRAVGGPVDFGSLVENAGGRIPEEGEDPVGVIEHLAKSMDAGLVASAGPRYFGFVIGGSVPAAMAADWLTTVWDQNAFNYASSPAAAAAEEIAARWLV